MQPTPCALISRRESYLRTSLSVAINKTKYISAGCTMIVSASVILNMALCLSWRNVSTNTPTQHLFSLRLQSNMKSCHRSRAVSLGAGLRDEALIHLKNNFTWACVLWSWGMLMSPLTGQSGSELRPGLACRCQNELCGSPTPLTWPHTPYSVLQQTVSRTIHERPAAAVNNSRALVHLSTKGRQTDGRTRWWK